MNEGPFTIVLFVLLVAAGYYYGITGLRAAGKDLPEELRGQDRRFSMIQLFAAIMGTLFFIFMMIAD